MAITQVISTIPEAGHRGVDARDAFVTKQEAFQDTLTATTVTELNTFKTQANTLETNVNEKEASAVYAKTLAESARDSAFLTANVTNWVSGATYIIGQNVLSLIDFKTYVRKTNGAGTTDPSLDATNYDLKVAPDNTKLPLAGGVMTGAIIDTVVDKGTISTGTVTFTASAGNVQRLQVGGVLTIATDGWATTGKDEFLKIILVNGGSSSVTLPSINWILPDGSKSTNFATYLTAIRRTSFQSSGVDFILLMSSDNGTTVYGKLA